MDDITIQAGATAFGDGAHPTTSGVLAALEAIDPDAFSPRIAADIGAGSGILALAIAARFACPVIASDIERQAVEIMQENFAASPYASVLTALYADGFNHPELQTRLFDLIVMNILAEPLLSLAAAAESQLAPEGVLILSGLLVWQEAQIRSAYQSLGLELSARLTVGDWVTLVWQKP